MNRVSLRRFGPGFAAWLFVFSILALTAAHSHAAPTLTTLVTFTGKEGANPGSEPLTPLVKGRDGNLYGATLGGGVHDEGTVYKVTPDGVRTTLVRFDATNGAFPSGAMVLGSDGDFYGTTNYYGAHGVGTIFKITQTGVLTTLYDFDSSGPNQPFREGLVEGRDGDFYGGTEYGANVRTDTGNIYKITPSGVFTPLATVGAIAGSLTEGTDGNFYGTTPEGGRYGNGEIFKMTPSGTITVLADFNGVNGSYPGDGLIIGTDGDFYGTTHYGGSTYMSSSQPGYGTVFKITPAGVLTTLYNFSGPDGAWPNTALVQGSNGNFYGTTTIGGSTFGNDDGDGTVFEITPSGALTTLVNFDGSNGSTPDTALVEDGDGTFYGTTIYTGTGSGNGTIFKLVLAAPSQPTLTSFSPGEGPVGSTVTLTGTGLDSVTAVRFHDQSAPVFYSSADGTQLTATVPEGADKGTITVTNPLGSATTATPFRITFHPVITSFSPISGPVGTVVVISGSHLDNITRVRFHLADATVYSSNAAGTQLTVTVPPGTHTGTITLDNRNALATTSSQVFTVTP